ncbi:MAG: hypothetical protein SFV54_27750 [Bryobacteraceae bacterium]|nr:hypothetical protein [Bryobacteraceae bacterium]
MNNFTLASGRKYAVGLVILGAIGAVLGLMLAPAEFYRAYLIGFVYWSGFALGGLGLLLLHHLVGGNWGFVTRRFYEGAARTLPLLAVLLIPLLIGIPHLYPWANQGAVAKSEILQHKQPYLNVPFFIGRLVSYFLVWFAISWIANRWSREQDTTGNPDYIRRFRAFSGPALIVHVFVVTFAAIDLLMTLEPDFFSTIFGAVILVGHVLATIALTIILLVLLEPQTPLNEVLGTQHLHDLGNLLLAFTMFWAYVEISQFIIIWHGNLPEEVPWYIRRSHNGWEYVTAFLALFHFVIPFLVLLNRFVKRRAATLLWVAAMILIMRWVDLVRIVRPAFWPSVGAHWMDIVIPLGIGGIWLAFYFWELGKQPILPRGDVRFSPEGA